jgi:hypothetical protein
VSRVRGRDGAIAVVVVSGLLALFAVRGGVPIGFSRGASGERSGSAAEACIRAGGAHDGIVGHGQAGLNQFCDYTAGGRVMPIVELATWSCPSLTPPRFARGIGFLRRADRSRRA